MKTLIFLFLLHFNSTLAYAGELKSFPELWKMIKSDHPELISSQEELEAAHGGSSRCDRHWLPSLYFSGKGFSTNDSTQNFIGNLGQRSIVASDFNPENLNNPGYHNFAQFSLGAQLPIYEGGRGVTQSQIQKYLFESKESLNSATQIEVYAQIVSLYAGLLNSNESISSLEELKIKVNSILSRYSLGSKSNPVGYSGLLGLKSILNRIDANLNELILSKTSISHELQLRAGKLPQDWQPLPEKVSKFLALFLPDDSIMENVDSYQMLAGANQSEIESFKISLQKSLFLPQFGVFAEGNYMLGSRTSGTGYMGGVYLHWSIFNPKDFGSVDESNHLFLASQARLNSNKLNEKLARDQYFNTLSVLFENEKLLNNSSELMNEQVSTSSRLFQSGSLNVLQMVEVFNRRADLISQLHELHLSQIKTRIELAKLSHLKGVQL